MDSTEDGIVEGGGRAKEAEAGMKDEAKQEDQNPDPGSAREHVEVERRNGDAT